MIKVCFVGDKPSNTNNHYDIPFVGAKCFNRLVSWIDKIQPDYYICVNSDSTRDWDKITCLNNAGFKFIALGNKASKILQKQHLIEHYKLPHPSGLNRKINNEMDVRICLLEAHQYVRMNLRSGECENIISVKEYYK